MVRKYSYRGQIITQRYRSHDVRNKTHNGYEWGIEWKNQFAHKGSDIQIATRAKAKARVDWALTAYFAEQRAEGART